MFQRKVNNTNAHGNDGILPSVSGETAASPSAATAGSSPQNGTSTTPLTSVSSTDSAFSSTNISGSSDYRPSSPTFQQKQHHRRQSQRTSTAETSIADQDDEYELKKKKKKPTNFRNIFLPLYHHPYKTQSTRRRRGGSSSGGRRRLHSTSRPFAAFVPACLVIIGGVGMIWMSFRLFSLSTSWSSSSSNKAPFFSRRSPSFKLVSDDAPVCRPLTSPEEITVTLVTQLSEDRLWMMEHHCDRYVKNGHPMSIAVYSNNTREQVLEMLREMDCPVDEDFEVGIDSKSDEQDDEDNEMGKAERLEEEDEENPDENTEREQEDVEAGGAADVVDGNQEDRRRLREEKPSSSKPLLMVSVLDARTHGSWNDYPVNELRNLALRQVDTSYIIYIDVDFWPSKNLYEIIVESPDVQDALLDDPKRALVIPAFSLLRQCHEWRECPEKNIPKMPKSLKDLARGIKKRRVTVFDPTNKGGHGSTDYKGWFGQHIGSVLEIPCLQSHRYEPFVMVRYCRDLPPFQEAFSGYGKNKVTWMMQVVASGYAFSQVGGAYLVHYPHLDSLSRQHWNKAPKELVVPVPGQEDTEETEDADKPPLQNYNLRRPEKTDKDLHLADYKRGQVDLLYVEFRQWLEKSIPADQARLPLCEDAQNDDGKLWIDSELKVDEEEDNEDHDREEGRS